MGDYLPMTICVRKGDILPGKGGFDIEIVGWELNNPRQAIGRRILGKFGDGEIIPTDEYFLVDGCEYEG
jgi:hypothetical protein